MHESTAVLLTLSSALLLHVGLAVRHRRLCGCFA